MNVSCFVWAPWALVSNSDLLVEPRPVISYVTLEAVEVAGCSVIVKLTGPVRGVAKDGEGMWGKALNPI